MKERIHNKKKDAQCQCCGIKESTIDKLDKLNLSIDPPMLLESEGTTFTCICSDCQFAIFEELWDNVVQKKKQPLFNNTQKSIKEFVEKNKAHFEDCARDYDLIVHVADHIIEHLKDMRKKNESADSPTGGIPLPTTRDVFEYITECNNQENNITGNWVTDIYLDSGYIEITEDNIDDLVEDKGKEALLDLTGACMVSIDVSVTLSYEEDPITWRVSFIAINETAKSKKTPLVAFDTSSDNNTGGFTSD